MIKGKVDGVANGIVVGWVADDERPGQPVILHAKLDGRDAGTALCNHYRSSLIGSKDAGPRCGLVYRVPRQFMDGKAHSISFHLSPDGDPLMQGECIARREEGPQIPQHEFSVMPLSDDHLIYDLFDTNYYLSQSGPVPDALTHYLHSGWRRGFNPHPLFDNNYYLEQCPYLMHLDMPPLMHFLERGAQLLIDPHPLFDMKFYKQQRPDAWDARKNLLLHYIAYGHKEGANPHAFFDAGYYMHHNAGVRDAGFNALAHYVQFGAREGRQPHQEFFPELYAKLAGLALDELALSHFIKAFRKIRKHKSNAGFERIVDTDLVILNFNKSLTTLQCIMALHMDMESLKYCNIIVVDNGSDLRQFELLSEWAPFVNIIRLNENRFFGEANNIAVERHSNPYIMFMNNDVFVTKNWLVPLRAALEGGQGVDAAGSKMLFRNGSLQEAGAMISYCGTATQLGRNLEASNPIFNVERDVDYCSAAALLMRRAAFDAVSGFDLCWDPAYYEDADLCLKVKLRGGRVVYRPESVVYHCEHTTAGDRDLGLRLDGIIEANREKFVSRWGGALSDAADRRDIVLRPTTPAPARSKRPVAILYSAYSLIPGGGERYLMSLAYALRNDHEVYFASPEVVSRYRLSALSREMDLDLDHVRSIRWSDAGRLGTPDIFISMGNEIFPHVPAIGRRSFYVCQFPFPMHRSLRARAFSHWEGYDAILCNSGFAAAHAKAAAEEERLADKPVHTLYPPVPQIGLQGSMRLRPWSGKVLNIGRFAPGGHCKRQDVAIDAFADLSRHEPTTILGLAGTLNATPESRRYLSELRQQAQATNTTFYVNASNETIAQLYRDASLYWHLTGFKDNPAISPERFEHFGISVAEAMSAGAIPVVLGIGGPAEIVRNGVSGFLIYSRDELVAVSRHALNMAAGQRGAMQKAAMAAAQQYTLDKFIRNFLGLLEPGKAHTKQSLVA